MRGSIWLLTVLTLAVGVWVVLSRPVPAAPAVSASRAAGLVEIAAPPAWPAEAEPRCLTGPPAGAVAAPAIPASLPGRVGLYAARFEAGEQEFKPSRVVQIRAAEVFPLASNYKTAVWLETLRQADQSRLRLGEKFVVTRANQSLGNYPYDHSDIETLAMRMIMWSDNTATDILHTRVGMGSLQPLADQQKLCNTRLLLPTKAWWAAEAGLGGPDFPKDALIASSSRFAQASPEERLEIAQRLYAAAERVSADRLGAALKPYFESRQWRRFAQLDRNLQNVSTPLEWAHYLWAAFNESGLSSANDALFRKVMAKGYGYRRLGVRYAYFGGKSGNTAGVLGFTGYLEAADGTRFVYVFLSDEVPEIYTLYFERPAFTLINRALLALGATPK